MIRRSLALALLALLIASCTSSPESPAVAVEPAVPAVAVEPPVTTGDLELTGELVSYVDIGYSEVEAQCLVDIDEEAFEGSQDTESARAAWGWSESLRCAPRVFGPVAGTPAPGIDPALDVLWEECAGGDSHACLQLQDPEVLQGRPGADYANFGYSCGGVTAQLNCYVVLDPASVPAADAEPPGASADHDQRWRDCQAGQAAACDELVYFHLDVADESPYALFGATCGGHETNRYPCAFPVDVP